MEQVTLEVLGERIAGVSILVSQGFEDIQRQLNTVASLPVEVQQLRGDHEALREKQRGDFQSYLDRHDALCNRVLSLEESQKRGSEWRRGSLPMIVLTVVMATVALASLLVNVISH